MTKRGLFTVSLAYIFMSCIQYTFSSAACQIFLCPRMQVGLHVDLYTVYKAISLIL
jgi:hypothetical protein